MSSNIFKETADMYGKEETRRAITLVDWYIDEFYPYRAGYQHINMDRTARMKFARKLLDCVAETCVGLDVISSVWKVATLNLDLDKFDPTILWATSPKVLGYGILKHPDYGFEHVQGTEYQPVEEFY